MPEKSGRSAHPLYVLTDKDDEEEDVMPLEAEVRAFEVELNTEARLDAADARAVAVYESVV